MIKSFDELSIKKYRELIELEKIDDTEYGLQILSILSDIEIDELLDMPLDDFTKLMGQTKFIYGNVERMDYKKLGKKITINGKEYRLVKNARDLSAGQYIDYKAYIQRENFWKMLPYILTIFLIPEGHKYNNGYDVVELANEFDEHLNLPTALTISDFFLHQSTLSIKSSVTSLKWMMKRMMKKEKNQEMKEKIQSCLEQLESLQNLLRVGDGFIAQ
jgi:hypothetical protein